jgi:hypothetical protein
LTNIDPKSFWAKVQKTESCWLWTAADNQKYGHLRVANKDYLAHRVAYQLTRGQIPRGMYVCHTCDVPLCVNPDHLFLGTNQTNQLDSWQKGKGKAPSFKGEAHPSAKLTQKQVDEIRTLYAKGHGTIYSLATDFKVSKSQVFNIVKKKSW